MAMVLALILVLLLSTVAVSLMAVTNGEIWSTMNYRLMVQARYAAEAGAQKAINYLVYTYAPPASADIGSYDLAKSPVQDSTAHKPVVLSGIGSIAANYPDAAQQTAFSTTNGNQNLSGVTSATYSVAATLLEMQPAALFGGGSAYLLKWQILSQGSIAGLRKAQVQVVGNLERTWKPVMNWAAFATAASCGAITMSSTTRTDSFDSSAGTYVSTQLTSSGNIGSNGNATLGGSSDRKS